MSAARAQLLRAARELVETADTAGDLSSITREQVNAVFAGCLEVVASWRDLDGSEWARLEFLTGLRSELLAQLEPTQAEDID